MTPIATPILRAPILRAAVAATLVAWTPAGCAGPSAERPGSSLGPPPEPPRVVLLVVVDAMRADRTGTAGYRRELTPNLDALAAEGVTLTAVPQATWTKPSMATLFTSLYPSQHGIQRASLEDKGELRSQVLGEEWETLAEAFRAGGYATGAVVNQLHLTEGHRFDQGFNHYRWLERTSAFQLNQALGQWLDHVGDERIFAWIHYFDPHWPYTRTLPRHKDAFGRVHFRVPPPDRALDADDWARENMHPRLLRALRNRYDREVAYTDAALGELVDDLKARGLWEETLMVVTADHGEGFWEHERLQHGFAPFEEVARVPMVIRLPERLRQRVVAGVAPLAGLIDLAPTLLDWAGLPPLPQAEGVSLVPPLEGRGEGRDLVFTESTEGTAVRSRSHKLIRFPDGGAAFFDLGADPDELQPMACAGEICEDLSGRLDVFLARMEETRGAVTETVALSDEEIEALEALGYL